MSPDSHKKEVLLYQTAAGQIPFEKWFYSLKDRRARFIIRSRLDRLEYGNAGNYESVGKGVYELRIYFGPGYRIYFGELDGKLIILLCGGDKSSQKRDIQKAYQYWADYRRKNETLP
jgi:putative addiction module killer protein